MGAIRLASTADAAACRAIYAPYVRDTTVSFELAPPSVGAYRRRMETTLETYPWLVWEDDGDVLGYAYAGGHRDRDAYQWAVESSVYVREGHHRAGIGRDLYESLFAVLRVQGFYHVYAGTTLPNPASVAFHRALGFEPVGVYPAVGYKHGAWHDVQWWHRSLGAPDADPEPPTPLEALRDGPAVADALADAGAS